MNTPKVLVVLGSSKVFGRERSNVQVFKFLNEYNYECLFITNSEPEASEVSRLIANEGFRSSAIPLAGIFGKNISLRIWIRKLLALFSANIRVAIIARQFKATHIHINGFWDFFNLWPFLFLTNIAVIYRIGDSPRASPRIFGFLWERIITKKGITIVCISQHILRKIESIAKTNDMTRIIYNYPPERDIARKEFLGLEKNSKIRILYIGQVIPQKGVIQLAEAARELCQKYSNLTFIIAGSLKQDESYTEALIQYIDEAGIQEYFEFFGHVNDIYSLIGKCDIHVMPSIYEEALGNVLVEAKSVGVPSVIFPVGGSPELIEHEVDGYVCKSIDSSALAEGIAFFLSDRIRMKAGSAAKASLHKLGITREAFIRAWRDVYKY